MDQQKEPSSKPGLIHVELGRSEIMVKSRTFQDPALSVPQEGQELWCRLNTDVRAAIVDWLDWLLKPGSRLPSTRSLVEQYGLPRATVATALISCGQWATYIRKQFQGPTWHPVCQNSFCQRRLLPSLPPSKATLSTRAREMLKGRTDGGAEGGCRSAGRRSAASG